LAKITLLESNSEAIVSGVCTPLGKCFCHETCSRKRVH